MEEKKNVPMIRMDQVSMQYSTGVDALCDVSIRIEKGEFSICSRVKVDRANPLLLNYS